MKKDQLKFLVVALFFAISASIQAESEEAAENPEHSEGTVRQATIIQVGQVKMFSEYGVQRIAVGDPALISASIIGEDRQLLIIGDNPGETDVRLWFENGYSKSITLKIQQSNPRADLQDLMRFTENIPGVKARIVGDKIILEGDVEQKDKEKIEKFSPLFHNVVDLTEPKRQPIRKMILMDVQIAEFSKNALQNLGINWAGSAVGPQAALSWDIGNSGGMQPVRPEYLQEAHGYTSPAFYFGIMSDITSRINLMKSQGDAYILASPRLSTFSGGLAEFIAGGEIPLPTVGADGQSDVTFKEYGIRLNILPVADEDGRINAEIETEISSIDPAVSVNNIPGFLTRRTKANISLSDGQTMVLSRLIDAEMSDNVDKLPGLGDLPIIGALFKSQDFRSKKTELVIFVTPHIVTPQSKQVKEALEASDRMVQGFQDKLGRAYLD